MKIIKGNLILKKDTIFREDIRVAGDIISEGGRWNIDAWNIVAWNIDARNIVAWNIDARNIDALDIICEKRIKKNKNDKTICRVYVKNKSKFERKEQEEI